MTKLVVLPAAALAPLELQAEFGEVPSGMVPLDSRPVLQHVAAMYQARGYDVLVAVHERADVVEDYFAHRAELAVRVLGIGRTTSIGETLLRALRRVPHDVEQLVVNFADTLLVDELGPGNVIAFHEQSDTYRWTTFRIDTRGDVREVIERFSDKGDDDAKVLVGVFAVDEVSRFIEELETAVADVSPDIDPFYTALRRHYNAAAPEQRRLHAAERWFDVGHLDTYYATRRDYFLNSRSFNSVQVDTSRGVIRKTSDNSGKFIDEVRWYLHLPRGLRHVAPRVFDHDLAVRPPWVEMEFYGYPTLNDAYLVGQWDGGLWRQVLRAVGGLLDSFAAHRDEHSSAAQMSQARLAMYETKTLDRLAPVLSDEQFARFRGDVVVNGERLLGLEEVRTRLPELLQASGALTSRPFTVLHGDLCLSNILYDRRNSIVRVVDPRGNFGLPGVYGDPLYDLAKLAHSLEGDYDLLVNGLFDSSWGEDGYELRPHLEPRHQQVKGLFTQWLADRAGDELAAVHLVEGLLFLSMVPLHADRPASQQAFLARGLQLVTAVARSLPAVTANRP